MKTNKKAIVHDFPEFRPDSDGSEHHRKQRLRIRSKKGKMNRTKGN